MERISLAPPVQPQWMQPKTFHNRFELRAGEHVYASLEFPKWFGTLAVARSADGNWTFKRAGFFQVRATIRREGEETDLGVFHPKWTGTEGTLKLANGAVFTWKASNFWATQFAWLGADGQPVMLFKPGIEDSSISDWFKTQSRVEIMPQAAGLPELSLLALLGWYLMVLKQQDDSSATATIP